MTEWLDVMAHPPEIGAWVLVLVDHWSSNMGQGEARHKLLKLSRFDVHTAVLVGYDSEGWPTWRKCHQQEHPMNGYHDIRHVTHYKLLEASVPDEETWKMPLWTSVETLEDGLACARRCAGLSGSCGRMRKCLERTTDNMFGRQF
jgi:hypothetical protein